MAVFRIDFRSETLGRITPLNVILPIERPRLPGTEIPERTEPFKTIYLLHGYSGNQNDWINSTRIELLARMYDVAIVMPTGENSFYLNDEILGKYYEDMVCEEIVNLTRKVFPLSDKREDTTIAGLSMGGYGAIRDGLKRSDVFGNIFAFSSALIIDEISKMKPEDPQRVATYSYYVHIFGELSKVVDSDVDPKALASKLVESGADLPKMYMACGTEDFLIAANRDYDQYLNGIGYEHTYEEGPGVHNWAFWDTYMEKAMKWLYGEPVFPL